MIKYLNFLLIGALFGCASSNYSKNQSSYLGHLEAKRYGEALAMIQHGEMLKDKQSRLLRLLEIGKIKFLRHEYFQSLMAFNSAQELSDQLFTVSVKKKISAFVANDSEDNYYGEKYERSLIRFYQLLNHYVLYQTGKYEKHDPHFLQDEKERDRESGPSGKFVEERKLSTKEMKFHLTGSRAVLVEWNALLENYRSLTGGEVTYKDDLMAKVIGSFIHEQIGTRGDLAIAKKLLSTAAELQFKNYNIFPSFNEKANNFKNDFSKLSQLDEQAVRSEYVSETLFAKDFKEYVAEKKSETRPNNIAIYLEDGLVGNKQAQKVKFPISLGASAGSGDGSFFSFVTRTLGVIAGTTPTISFELPEFSGISRPKRFTIELEKEGKVHTFTLVLISPLTELAVQSLSESALGIKAKLGARLAVKHLAALSASYLTYKALLKSGTPDFLAMAAGGAEYAIANKAIASSEQADLRSWLSLPMASYFYMTNVRPGTYNLRVKQGPDQVVHSTKVVVGKKAQLISIKI